MDFEAARVKMVDNQIRTTDVTDHQILRAFLQVPREEFLPASRKALAYVDDDIALGDGRFVVEPSPLAKLLQLAGIDKNDVVLDVGCNTGYSSAILSHLANSVVALEEDPALAAAAADNLARLDYLTCAVVENALVEGCKAEAPFDVILFQGAIETLPQTFYDQMKTGGRMVAVRGIGNAAEATLYVKDEEGIVSERFAFNCALKPLPSFRRKVGFVF
ncbi:protein-L-isoaspartate O-methyltransferase [Jiella sp. MQZ9-1]|uniref:Protein-L-isoaspartate O-methyltransferase n=1 Tax=Jiella flava TaxID=2816857 RepID=A0A939JVP9_9HYPH|nr:protein-L-isoaspartate O-methyltransferase [Jiella flava]MBO0664445.1 protein-L-isoaspartate O-methyltransferase [Jiella flava]MCD2473081.1 protein-L-isoaspartate O-methyltransferase [Jiella flava]